MKLKKAKKIAKANGCKWIAVDSGGMIFMYHRKPLILEGLSHWSNNVDYHSIDSYSGTKYWRNTLRKVK